MISVLISTLNDAARLSATLAALAPAAMDGFVRQVIVSDQGSTDATLEVADDAGADIVTTGLADAIKAARQPWLLFLAPGARPQVGWERAAHAHIRDHPDMAGWFDLAIAAPGLGARVEENLAWIQAALTGRARPEQGLLICKPWVGEMEAGRFEDIVRGLRSRRFRSLGARALIGRD